MAAAALLPGTGSTALWGFSKALDLQDPDAVLPEKDKAGIAAADAQPEPESSECLDILLVGASDIRHFYIIEPQSSLLARDMLALSILFEPPEEIGLQELAELFLECYGNLLVRRKTADWITQRASDLIRAMTDEKGLLGKLIDFSALRFRERDDIEFVLKFWRDTTRPFDAQALWEVRLRRHYGVRYDMRDNAIDWDYNMRLRDMDPSTSIVYKAEFMRWRLHGTAFEVRESSYDCANRSMATVDILKQDGVGVAKWGYFSDILFGPYAAFGLDTEAKDMLKKQNDMHKHTSQEISEFNVRSMLHELTTGTPHQEGEPPRISDKAASPYSLLDRVKISFLPCDPSRTFETKRAKYQNKFHVMFFSNAMAHRVADAPTLLHPDGKVIVETAKFMMELTKDQTSAFREKLNEMASAAGLARTHPAALNDNEQFLVFRHETARA